MPKSPLLKPAIAGRCACVRSCSLEPAGPSSCNDDPKLFIGLIAHQIRAVSASMQAPAPAHVPTPAHTDHVLTHLTAPAAAPSVPAPAAAAHPAPAAHKRRLLPPSLTPHPNPPPAPNVKTPHGPDKRLCHRPSNENCPDTHAHTAPQGLSGARAVAGTVGVGGGREEARAQARPRSGLRAAGCSAVQEGGDRLVALQRSGLPELRFYGEVRTGMHPLKRAHHVVCLWERCTAEMVCMHPLGSQGHPLGWAPNDTHTHTLQGPCGALRRFCLHCSQRAEAHRMQGWNVAASKGADALLMLLFCLACCRLRLQGQRMVQHGFALLFPAFCACMDRGWRCIMHAISKVLPLLFLVGHVRRDRGGHCMAGSAAHEH